MQAAGNHQVQNQPDVAFYSNGDSLADSAQLGHGSGLDVGNWRLRGSKQKKTGQAHALDWLRENARLECGDVGGDVGKFRHEYELAGCMRAFATSFKLDEAKRRVCGRSRGCGRLWKGWAAGILVGLAAFAGTPVQGILVRRRA